VAHVREELGLGAVDLGERLGAPALLLVGARVPERQRDLPREQGEEAAVAVVERAAGAYAHHQHADGALVLRPGEREGEGGAHRVAE
jgi:hypothetical protein